MSFRFAAKYGLFTYAQCGDLDAHAVVCHFTSLGAECIIGRENHADGGIHLHAFAMWEKKFQTTSARRFDVLGRHANVVPGYGTPEKGWDYATKDGDVVGGGLERPCGDSVDQAGSKWSQIIAQPTAAGFWEHVALLDPRALCVSFGNLQKYADWKYRPDVTDYENPPGIQYDLVGSPRLSDWWGENIGGPGGEPRVGR